MNRALLSAYNKTENFADFAQHLIERGWQLVGPAGTVRFLDQRGITARSVPDLVGPPILGHRVVTPLRDTTEDRAELFRINVEPFDLVYVDLCPLAEALTDPKRTIESVREKIDIDGSALLRAAAKGERIVLCRDDQFASVKHLWEKYPNDSHKKRTLCFILAGEVERMLENHCHLARRFYDSVGGGVFPNIPEIVSHYS